MSINYVNPWFPEMIRRAEELRETMQRHRDAPRDRGSAEDRDRVCLQNVGFVFSVAQKSSPEMLHDLLSKGSNPDERGLFLAELLIEEAAMHAANGDFANTVRAQVQAFYLIGKSVGQIAPEHRAPFRGLMDELAALLNTVDATPYLTEKLQAFGYRPNSPLTS